MWDIRPVGGDGASPPSSRSIVAVGIQSPHMVFAQRWSNKGWWVGGGAEKERQNMEVARYSRIRAPLCDYLCVIARRSRYPRNKIRSGKPVARAARSSESVGSPISPRELLRPVQAQSHNLRSGGMSGVRNEIVLNVGFTYV